MTRVSKLDSGLTIVSAEMPYSASVSIGVFVKVGSRDESGSQYGASHFLEHLIFKGTESLSARDLAVVVDSFGGEMNAFTTKETTSFQLRLLDEAVEIGIDILGQILTAPALRPLDIDSERSVILEEIAMASDEPADLVQEMLASVIYNGHPLGREVLGSRESIISMDRATIDKFFTAYYGPPNMVVAAAGHVNHDLLIEKFQAMFTSLQAVSTRKDIYERSKFGDRHHFAAIVHTYFSFRRIQNLKDSSPGLLHSSGIFGSNSDQTYRPVIINRDFGSSLLLHRVYVLTLWSYDLPNFVKGYFN